MIKRINLSTVVFFLGLLLLFACQKESEEIIDPPSEKAFIAGSVVSDIMQRTTLLDGSFDNILDRASCTSVVLPVTVIVAGEELTINSEEDFNKIEVVYNESDDDEHDLSFIFPIEIILADHSKITVIDADELESITKDCVENGDDEDIECVDFKYPLSFSVYDKVKEVAEVITFNNDDEMYRFLENLDESDLVSIDFPITMILSDASEITVNSNDMLENLIESAEHDCDEHDRTEYEHEGEDDDDSHNSTFISSLITGEWIISYFSKDGEETSVFEGYKFMFYADGTAMADNGSSQINGTWESKSEDDSRKYLVMKFGETAPFVMLEDDWKVTEFDENIIKLMDEDKAEESNRFLSFERP
jgi:hypothetical protein